MQHGEYWIIGDRIVIHRDHNSGATTSAVEHTARGDVTLTGARYRPTVEDALQLAHALATLTAVDGAPAASPSSGRVPLPTDTRRGATP